MAGNLLQVGSDHKLRISSASKIVVAGASDPCCCSSATCTQCSGTVPSSITVVLADITLCASGCIWSNNGGSNQYSNLVTAFNGTYTALYVAPCAYQVKIGEVDIHDNVGCSSLISDGTFNNGGVFLDVTLMSDGIEISVSYRKIIGGSGTFAQFFYHKISLSSPYDCTAARTFNNDRSTGGCDPASDAYVAYGGTADI